MKTQFEIFNPSHKKYQKGKLQLEFDKDTFSLKKINFYIDQDYYFLPTVFGHGRQVLLNWVFQKQYSLKALNNEELDKISCLTNDVLKNFQMENTFENLLSVIDNQIRVYKVFTQDKPDAKTHKKLVQESKQGNMYIKKVNQFMHYYSNHYSNKNL